MGGQRQQNCWSESLPWMPRLTTSPCSPPESGHSASLPGSGCYYQELQQKQSWAGAYPGPLPPLPVQPEPQAVSLDQEREEMRMKLHAIFNPYQVDKVMSMYPHLKDAQKLAAEILTLKSKGEMF